MTRTEKRLESLLGRTETLYAAVFATNPFPDRDAVLSALHSAIDLLEQALCIERAEPAARRK